MRSRSRKEPLAAAGSHAATAPRTGNWDLWTVSSKTGVVRSLTELGSVGTGRSRWLPDGTGIATIGFDASGKRCIWVQDFAPEKDTASTKRSLLTPGEELNIDTFGLSPDGKRITIEHLEELSSVALAEGVAGL